MNPILGYDYETIARIVWWADQNDLPPVLLLAMGLQEAQLNVNENTGDRGLSFGDFQIYTVVHGGPGSKWMGYDGLMRSMDEMRGRWQSAFAHFGGWAEWLADGVAFQQAWTPEAQGSIDWTEPMARHQVSLANGIYCLYLKSLLTEPAQPAQPAEPCPALSPEWMLRVGLSADLVSAATLLLDARVDGTAAVTGARQLTQTVQHEIDAVGGA